MTDKYTSAWQSRLDETMQKILNREKFSYDLNADALYRQYKDMYTRQGRAAMEDTVGRAAALTGGYGNSYAQNLGQQQYGAYLEKLNDTLPELYGQAYERYQREGEALNQRLSAAGSLANADFDRYKDAADREDNKAAMDYKKQQDAYKNLADAIASSGYLPTDEELKLSGMSPQLAAALSYEFLRRNDLLPAGTVYTPGYASGAAPGVDREWLKISQN